MHEARAKRAKHSQGCSGWEWTQHGSPYEGHGKARLCRQTEHRIALRDDGALYKADKGLDQYGVPGILSPAGWNMVLITPRL